jgi:uncharacterized protein YqeY
MANSKGAEYGWHQDMPMSLHDKIRADLKTSMRNKAAEVKSTMRLIMAEFPKLTVPLTLESGKKTTRLKKPEDRADRFGSQKRRDLRISRNPGILSAEDGYP